MPKRARAEIGPFTLSPASIPTTTFTSSTSGASKRRLMCRSMPSDLVDQHKPMVWAEEDGQIIKSLGPFISTDLFLVQSQRSEHGHARQGSPFD